MIVISYWHHKAGSVIMPKSLQYHQRVAARFQQEKRIMILQQLSIRGQEHGRAQV